MTQFLQNLGLPFWGNPVIFPLIPCQHSGLSKHIWALLGAILHCYVITFTSWSVSGISKNTPATLNAAGYYVHIHEVDLAGVSALGTQ